MRKVNEQRFPILADIAAVPIPKKRKIQRIYIHCSASDYGDAEIIDDWHETRGWKGIGYNYVVGGAVVKENVGYSPGFIQIGRDVERCPAHVKSDNVDSLGICIVGNFDDKSPLGKAEVGAGTRIAIRSAMILVAELSLRLGLPVRQIVGHHEVNLIPGKTPTTKSCPGHKFNMDVFRCNVLQVRQLGYTSEHASYRLMVERFVEYKMEYRRYKFLGTPGGA